ncbi:MAG: hypothetical protein RL119_519 [Actinomycetota bacterium]
MVSALAVEPGAFLNGRVLPKSIPVSVVESTPPRSTAAICLLAPVPGKIVGYFQAPGCPYCAGRRAIDFAVVAGDVVRSPVAGQVSFAGTVAGTGYVTVVPSGAPSYLVTVGGVGKSELVPGNNVLAGAAIGTAEQSGLIPLTLRRVLSSGLKTYLDPEQYLAQWRVRARLIPIDGGAARQVGPIFGCRIGLGDRAAGFGSR